jgi:hypothetical protein
MVRTQRQHHRSFYLAGVHAEPVLLGAEQAVHRIAHGRFHQLQL